MAGAAFFENGHWLIEGLPLGDSQLELAGVFELFESEEVFPVGVVLNTGDAVGEGVGDSDGHGLTALFEGRRRNFCDDESVDSGFAEDASGRAGRIVVGPIDLGAGWIWCDGGYVGGGERGCVRYGHVA